METVVPGMVGGRGTYAIVILIQEADFIVAVGMELAKDEEQGGIRCVSKSMNNVRIR